LFWGREKKKSKTLETLIWVTKIIFFFFTRFDICIEWKRIPAIVPRNRRRLRSCHTKLRLAVPVLIKSYIGI
jgi:hypothetical protein